VFEYINVMFLYTRLLIYFDNIYKAPDFSLTDMAISQVRSKRKPTGGRYKRTKGKKHHACGNTPVRTRVGEIKKKSRRTRGGTAKEILLKSDIINLIDSKSKKSFKAKIKNVVDNPANRNFIRANILTKGTVVETEKGKARITNRPGQEGTVNGVLI